jgi:hypothetical protein
MSLREVEKHCRIAACGDEAAGWRMGLEAILFEMFSAVDATDAILSIQNSARTAVRFEHRRRGGKLLERAPGFLTTGAIANGAGDWRSDSFVFHAAASAPRLHNVHLPVRHRQLPLLTPLIVGSIAPTMIATLPQKQLAHAAALIVWFMKSAVNRPETRQRPAQL